MAQNSLLTRCLPFRYKIYATLDLNKSLEEFKENVTKILELTDIENWDGINQAKQVLLIADGAEWIGHHIPPLLEKLNCPLETYQLLDFPERN